MSLLLRFHTIFIFGIGIHQHIHSVAYKLHCTMYNVHCTLYIHVVLDKIKSALYMSAHYTRTVCMKHCTLKFSKHRDD